MKIYKHIHKLGSLLLGYSLLKSLGMQNAIVLERILTEGNHACSHNFLTLQEYFAINVEETAYHLGINSQDVVDSINYLVDLNFINVEQIDNELCLVKINEDEIIEYEYVVERRGNYKSWNYKLTSIQNIFDE